MWRGAALFCATPLSCPNKRRQFIIPISSVVIIRHEVEKIRQSVAAGRF